MKKTITIASIQMYVHQDKNKNIEQLKTHLNYLGKLLPQVKMVILLSGDCHMEFPVYVLTGMISWPFILLLLGLEKEHL